MSKGRWPTNVILQGVPVIQNMDAQSGDCRYSGIYSPESLGAGDGPTDPGKRHQGQLYQDSGGASRYFKQVRAEQESFRAFGDVICSICGKPYNGHPDDPERPYLTRLCDRSLVKL